MILGLVFLAGAPARIIPSASFKRLGLVRIEGIILNSESIVKQLSAFRTDKSVAGILVKINSPGGATAPSQEIYKEILRIKEESKPLVVSMGDLAASGGYYVASPARCIFADPGTLTGSIGVILTVPIYKDLANKIGIQMNTLKAGEFKDIASNYRVMTDGEKKKDPPIPLMTPTISLFDDVAKARGRSGFNKNLADGRIFTGRQAQALGLVDSLGGYLDALSYLRKITGSGPNTRIIEKSEKFSNIREWLLESAVRIFPQLYTYFAPYRASYLMSFE